MAYPDDVVHQVEETLGALWYLARYPLRRPRLRSMLRARALDPADRGIDDIPLTEASLLTPGPTRFLDVYSREGVLRALRAHGILDHLAARGFSHVDVTLDLRDPFHQRVTVFDGEPSRELGELVATRRRVNALGDCTFERPVDVIDVAWLTLRDPDNRTGPVLPGQERAGLGLLRAVVDMTLAGAQHLGFAAMLATPAHYHLAWMYHPWYRPLDPQREGVLLALRRAAGKRSLRDTAWCVADGRVRRDGVPWRWEPFTMCAPLDPNLRAFLASFEYARRAMEAAHDVVFTIDEGDAP
jgi:hypothetical protein